MKKIIWATTTVLSAVLMVMGILYLIQRKQDEKIGGRLIKVDYRFSKEF
ncbi:stress-responsive transcriptional regulator PspC [Alkalibacter mobilis]|nr:stress-responsive transcriptional regulator PspC [Alkalibacter mobilis]MBF7097744.1 stress-responsive transcriptional regulator PspC [Alkalibacter mobilis]